MRPERLPRPRMRRLPALLLFALASAATADALVPESLAVARQGILDLGGTDFPTSAPLALDGEWAFYWNTLLPPGTAPAPEAWARLPLGLWQDIRAEGAAAAYPNFGYASYRLVLRCGPEAPELALKVPEMFAASRIWINGRLAFSAGTVGTDASSSRAAYRTGIIRFDPVPGDNELLIQVSNFQERRGGLNRSPVLGPAQAVNEGYFRSLGIDLLVFGLLIGMGVYHLCFFAIRRQDRTPLWFGLFCLIIALRALLYGERFLFQLMPGLPWAAFNAADHLSFYLGIPIFGEYLRLIFLKELSKPVLRAYQGLGLVFALCLFLPPTVYNTTVVGYEILTGLMAAYTLVALVRALRHRRDGAVITTLGLGLFLACGVNEILHNTGVIHSFNSLTLGLVLFLLSQAALLALRFARTVETSENLGDRLRDTNQSLRRFIPQEFFQLLNCRDISEIRLGSQVQRDMSVMFSDIRGFTALAEQMSASETLDFLNSCFGRIGATIRANGGFVDKNLGDGIMALFPGQPDDALEAAVQLQGIMSEYNALRAVNGKPAIVLGTGIHLAPIVLGTVGERDRTGPTVIADAVNLASRLEGLTKLYGTGTIVTRDFIDRLECPERFKWRALGLVRMPGWREPVDAVHVYDGLLPDEFGAFDRNRPAFAAALELFRQGAFAEARLAFLELAARHPEDPAAANYLSRISLLLKAGLTQDGDGMDTIQAK